MAFGNLGTIWSEIGLETKRLSAGVTTAKMKLSELDRQAMTKTASINAKLRTIGTGLQTVGRNMSMYVTLPLMAVGAAATKAGMDFDSGMTKSLAIMNNITPQIRKQMELTAKDVVKYTTFSAKEAADAYFYLASAGLDAAQSIEALPKVAKFAQAGNFDLALATDLLTDAQSALGLTIRDDVVANMENMTRVSDVLVKANTLSNATVRQFSESLTNKAGPALRMLNKDIEEGTAVLAVYADQGIKGAEAGNYLNIILRDLQRSSINNAEAFKQFGVDVFDASGQVRNIADIIGDLEDALDGMSDKEKRATLMMMGFQDRSISAMMALLGTSDAIRDYEKELRSATGFTEAVAEKQMESFAAQVEQLKNELVLVGIQIFDILRPKLMSLVEQIKKAIDWFDDLTDSQKNLIINMGIFAVAIGPVAYALSGLTKIIVGVRTAVVGLTIANRGLMASIKLYILVAAAILAVGQAGDWAANKIDNYYLASLARTVLPHAGFVYQTKLMIEMIKGLADHTLTWSEYIRMNGREMDEWAQKHREAVEVVDDFDEVLESSEKFIKKHSETLPLASAAMVDLIQDYQDGTLSAEGFKIGVEELRKATQNGRIDIEEAADSVDWYAEAQEIARRKVDAHTQAQKDAKEPIEDTTGAIDDQTESVDNLRGAFNDLIGTIFDGITTYNDFQESGIAVKEIQTKINKLIEEGKQDTDEYIKAENELDDAIIKLIEDSFALSTSIYATTEQQEEARKKAMELGLEYINTGRISAEQFMNMASEFGLRAADIILYAEEMGIVLDEATRERILSIDNQTEDTIQMIVNDLARIKDKTVYVRTYHETYRTESVKTKYYTEYGAMGGIVGYGSGGIIGSDGTRQPILSAAYGMVTPQRGREVPILAHEGEVILNTSQQRNLAEWIMGKAKTVPQSSGGMVIENLNVITPKGTPAEIANETEFLMRQIGMEYGLR